LYIVNKNLEACDSLMLTECPGALKGWKQTVTHIGTLKLDSIQFLDFDKSKAYAQFIF